MNCNNDKNTPDAYITGGRGQGDRMHAPQVPPTWNMHVSSSKHVCNLGLDVSTELLKKAQVSIPSKHTIVKCSSHLYCSVCKSALGFSPVVPKVERLFPGPFFPHIPLAEDWPCSFPDPFQSTSCPVPLTFFLQRTGPLLRISLILFLYSSTCRGFLCTILLQRWV